MIDIVSETYRTSWDKAVKLPVFEFLNVYLYHNDLLRFTNAQLKGEYDKMKSRMSRRY